MSSARQPMREWRRRTRGRSSAASATCARSRKSPIRFARNFPIGGCEPGDRLPPERVLAEQFGVSRNTLREALRSLENAGLLRLQKGATGGAFVRESTGDAIITGLRDMFHLGAIQPEHLTEARVMIESIAVRAACERATPEDIEALNANIASAAKAAREKINFYDQAAIHLDFHRIIARATKNPVMVIVMEALIDVMQHFIRAIGQKRNPWVLPSRRRFMKHFEAGDSDAAVKEMEQHLERLESPLPVAGERKGSRRGGQ